MAKAKLMILIRSHDLMGPHGLPPAPARPQPPAPKAQTPPLRPPPPRQLVLQACTARRARRGCSRLLAIVNAIVVGRVLATAELGEVALLDRRNGGLEPLRVNADHGQDAEVLWVEVGVGEVARARELARTAPLGSLLSSQH